MLPVPRLPVPLRVVGVCVQLAEFRQRKAKGDGAHPEKEKKKGKRTPLHQHGLATEEHALTSDETEVGVDVSVKTIVGEQSLAEDDASGGLGSFEPETREDNSSEVPPPLMDRDTDVLMALQITQFEAAIQQRDEIITQLSANLQQALSSRDGVQQETQHLTTHIQSLQQQLQQASEMLRSTRQLSQTQELAQTQQQLSTCQKLLCQKTSELLRLRSRLELARTTEQQAAVASLETGPDGLAQGTENHKEHILVLQKELQESNATANKLEATLSQKEAIILMLQQTMHSKDGSPVSTSASTTETEATLCELTENVGEAERTVAELQREISSKDLAMEELRMRLSASTEKEEQLSRENFKLLNDLDNLSKKEGRPDGNLTQLAESDWERREGELRTLLGEEHDRQLAELGSQMRQEVKRQQRDIDELTENNSKLNESLLQLKEFNSQLNASLRDSQAQLSSLQEQLSSASSASTEMDAQHMRELENFCVKLEILEKGRTEAQGRVSELEELNAEMSRGREEAQRALEQIREQQNKDTEGLREALGLEYKGSIDKLTADVENLNVALSQSAEELRSMKQTLELKYIEEMEGLKQSLQQEQKENVDKLLADNERLNKELSLSQEALKSELGKVPANKNDPRSIEDQCSRELENEKEALVQEYKGNLEKLEAELKTLKEDLVHAKQEAVRALEEQQQRHIAEVDILNETLRQEHKVSLDKLLVDIENLTVTLSQHKQEAQSALENQQQQHLLSQNVQKETMAQEHKENVDKLLGDLKRLKEELLNNKEETQSSLEKVKQQHDIEMKVLKESLSQENKVTVDNLQAEVEKLNNELSRSRLEADNRYEQMKQDHSRQVEVLQEQLKEQQKGTQDDVCTLEKLSQHHREEMKELEEALRLEHKETVDKLLADTEKLNTELTLSRQGTQEQVQQQQSRHTEEVQKMREQHIKELELLKKTADQEHTMRVNRLTTDIEKLGTELSLSKEEALHAANNLHEQHTRELEQLKESLTKENKQNTEKLLADLEKSHNFTLKESQQKQKDVDNLAQQLEEKHRLSLEVTLKDVENQSRVAIEKSMAELDNKHAEELAALKEDFREKMEKLRQEKKSLELEQHQSEEDMGGILRELEGCVTFQEILKISASSSDNVHAPGPTLVPSNPSAEAVADPQALNSDPVFQKQGRQVKQLICALRQQCIAMKERLEVCMEGKKPCELTATAVVQSRIHQQDAQCQCESNSTLDAASQSMVDGAADTGRAQLSTAGDEQGQRSVTVSTAIPPADEFNALLQEKRVLEETVSDLHKTCNSQQKEIASLKAQTGDDEVEKTQVLCKGCGGVAELNAGSLTDVQTGAVGEPDLAGPTGPIPQAAPPSHVPPVEQAQDVHVSLLKGWAAGSPPHDGPDGKVTMTPAPADQEACERGVQQRRGRPDSEPEQGSKAQLVKQKAELQEELGRVNVQVQVQQKGHKQQGHKQQQQRKLHRKQQKKHPGMVLVQHMSVVPEEGQEGQGGAQEDADDATRCDMSGVPAAPQAAGGDQRASVEEVHMLRLALAQKEEELEALRVCMSTLQGAAEQASGSGLHSDEQTPHDAAEPSNADSNVRQQTHLYKATETISINMPSQPLLVAAPEGLMPELVMDPKGITVCTKAAADSGNVNQGQHLKSDKVPPQKHLAAGHPKSISSRGSATSQGNIPGETRTLSRTEITNKQKPAAKSANVKKREPASQTKPANRAARATPPTVPCGTCKHLEEERDGLMEGLRLERETCRQLQRRLQVLQQQRACTGVSGDATVAGQVGLRGGHSMAQVDLVMEPRKGSPCMQVVTHREESEEPNLPMIDDSASGVVTEMQASTCLEAAGKVSFLRGSQTEEGAADLKTPNGNGDAAQASEGSRVIASDGGSSDIAHLSDSTDMLRRHSLMQCACRRLQLVSTTTRDLLSQISIRVISVVDLAQDEEVAQLVQRLKELDVEIAHSEADLTWDSRSASGDPLGRVARQLSELYGRVAALSEEKEELNAVVLELTRSLQRRAARTPPGCASGSEPPASSLRNERELALRRADRSSPTAERALLCVPVSKFQSLHRRFTRAESQRRALLHQKRYLLLVLGSFAGAEQPALTLLARPRVELLIAQAPAAPRAAARGRFRVAARAVAATCRLRRLLQKQQRQESCPAYGWKVDVPAKAAFTAPGELYHRRTLDAVEREHFWNCPPWVSHSTPCVEEHRNPNFFLQDYIHKLESIQLRLGPYYTEASSFTRLAKKP